MRLFALLAACLFGLFLTACSREVPIRAEVIYTGGTIYTGAKDGETVEAVAVGDGMIVYAGTMATAIKASRDGAKIIDLGDSVMFPGFTDAHVHLGGVGQRELTLNLDQVRSVEELKASLLAYKEFHADLTGIQGRGWIETHWPEKRFPTAADIDTVIADIPVILVRADGHALVANTKAMEVAGITAETPAPKGGAILKDEGSDLPNGMFVDMAMALLQPVFADPTDEEVKKAVETGLDVYASRGWTGLHNMSVSEAELKALGELSFEVKLPLRTYNAVVPEMIDYAIKRAPSGALLTTRAVKLYVDGALGSRGALLLEPYSDAPDTSGLALTSGEETGLIFQKALKNDVQVAMHAIGDRGNKLVLDWMEDAFKVDRAADENAKDDATHPDVRWRIEHSQIVRAEDRQRFADLGVIASMQPSHAIGDLYFAPSRLGMDRLDRAYAWSDMIKRGVIVAGGSDAPVEVGDPIIEFYAATVRKSLDGFSAEGWHPEYALSRYDALRLFTQFAAYASFQEETLGTIETGKFADFSVFDQDLMKVADEDILKTKPVMTIVGGKVVWEKAG